MGCSHEHCGDFGHVEETARRIIARSTEAGAPTIPASVSIQDVLDMACALMEQIAYWPHLTASENEGRDA